MGMVIKRRQLVMATMVLALGAAVFVNWYFTKPHLQTGSEVNTGEVVTQSADTVNLGDAEFVNGTTKAKDDKSSTEYFAQARINRNTAHDKSLEMLNSVISNKSASKSSIDAANTQLTKLAEAIKKETDIENLIKAKLKGDCIVIINDSKVEVIVEKGTLNDNIIIQIKEIVIKQCEIKADNITIIEAK